MSNPESVNPSAYANAFRAARARVVPFAALGDYCFGRGKSVKPTGHMTYFTLLRSSRAFALVAAAAAFGLFLNSRAEAEFLPNPQQIARPSETEVLADIAAIIGEVRDAANALPRLDQALSRLREPTPMRGLVQYLRGNALLAEGRTQEGRESLEESIRLLPGYSGPLLAASFTEAYADRPGQATDYLLRASEIDPDIVRQIPDYELENILGRLASMEDNRRRRQLAERLFAIGWLGESLVLRSSLARNLIEAHVETGDIEAARTLIPRIVSPGHVRHLLMQNRYSEIWDDLDRWAGSQQERLWPSYLRELRAKWRASRDPEHAASYVGALSAANHYRTIVTEMLPLFLEPLDEYRDYELIWVAVRVADALARLGRWSDIDAMYSQASQTWPMGSHANALNISANRARFHLYRGNPAAAVSGLEAAIADAANYSGEVSAGALASMHYYRACALHELGRDSDAITSVAVVLQQGNAPTSVANLHLCFGRHDAARAVLIEALEHEHLRDDVIAYVQPDDSLPTQSDYGRRLADRRSALKADPILLREVAKYGRVLPNTLSAGAPSE